MDEKEVYIIRNVDFDTCRIVKLTKNQCKAIQYVFDEFSGAEVDSLEILSYSLMEECAEEIS